MENNINSDEVIWDPMEIFTSPYDHKYAVLVLNQPILLKKELLLQIWKNAEITITVDGGTNCWLDYLDPISNEILNGKYPELTPNLITGDLDSISPVNLDKMMKLGVEVIKTSDQNETDYTKALIELSIKCKQMNINLDAVYVIMETSGRFDHIISNINTLYKSRKFLENVKIVHVASNSLTWLLSPGKHRIKIPEKLRKFNSWVGIIPFGCSIHDITSTGLKWNLNNITLSFGDLISTSNTYDGSPEVTINTKENVVWTMDIESLFQ